MSVRETLEDARMLRTLMKSKVHRATVTEANLNYVGSLTLDKDLMELADFSVNEKVQVVDIDNGERFETYLIEGERGSGVLCLNGAAARRAQPGDKVIVISYGMYDEQEMKDHEPLVVVCDEHNHGELLVKVETAATTTGELIAGNTPAAQSTVDEESRDMSVDKQSYSPVQIRDIVLNLYQEVLGDRGLGAQDDFFEHGGDSEKGVVVLHRLRDITGARLHMSNLYMAPTADGLSEEVASALAG